jgi:hypothetical protein
MRTHQLRGIEATSHNAGLQEGYIYRSAKVPIFLSLLLNMDPTRQVGKDPPAQRTQRAIILVSGSQGAFIHRFAKFRLLALQRQPQSSAGSRPISLIPMDCNAYDPSFGQLSSFFPAQLLNKDSTRWLGSIPAGAAEIKPQIHHQYHEATT